jgi:hypothetical protein
MIMDVSRSIDSALPTRGGERRFPGFKLSFARLRSALLAALVSLLGGATRSDASDAPALGTAELLKTVPADTAACLVVEDLASRLKAFQQSSLVTAFNSLPAVKRWRESPAYKGLEQIRVLLPLYTGLTVDELRDDIFGVSFILSLHPGASGDDTGLLLIYARSEDRLERLFSTLAGGSAPSREHRGVRYRIRKEAGREEFLVRMGPIGLMADREDAVKASIDARLDGKGASGVAEILRMRKSGGSALVQLMIVPRRLDALLEKSIEARDAGEKAFKELVLANWARTRWVSWSLRTGKALALELEAEVDEGSPGLESPLEGLPLDHPFWKRVPADAMAAVAGRAGLPAIIQLVRGMMPEKERREAAAMVDAAQQLMPDHDLATEGVRRIGPAAFGFVRAVPGRLAPEALAGIELDPVESPADKSPTLAQALESALRPVAVGVGLEHNRKTGDTMTTALLKSPAGRIHYWDRSTKLPTGIRPAFQVSDRLFSIATGPEPLATSANPKVPGKDAGAPARPAEPVRQDASPSLAGSSAWGRMSEGVPAGDGLLAVVRTGLIRDWLTTHRTALLPTAATPADLEKFEMMVGLLGLGDTVTLSAGRRGGVLRMTVTLHPPGT